jgi:spermidine synthase
MHELRIALRLFMSLCLISPLIGTAAADEPGQLIYEENSLYHRIFVYRDGAIATLRFGKQDQLQVQSKVNLNDLRQHRLEYTALAFCGLLYEPQPRRMLVLGLGGGVIPREMRHYYPSLKIEVAEIDPAIPLIASRFFGFREDDALKVYVDDGRVFIKKRLRKPPVSKYDIIILDAFNSDYIPFHLMTKEFLTEVKGVLAEDGVVIANVFHTNRLFDAELKTFLDVFQRCQVFFGVTSGNAMLVAPGPACPTLSAREAIASAKRLQTRHNFPFDMAAIARHLKPEMHPDPNASILTDDLAPVNWLREQPSRKRTGIR